MRVVRDWRCFPNQARLILWRVHNPPQQQVLISATTTFILEFLHNISEYKTEMLSLVREIVELSEHVKSIFKGFDLLSLVFPWIFLNDKEYRHFMATDNLKSTKQKKDKSGLLRKTPFYLKTFLYLRQSCHRTWPGND